MATRITYPIFQEMEDGTIGFKKDVDVSTDLSYKKDGGAYTPGDSGNNGDGTYYFTITESAYYTVLLSGTEQDEFKNIYCAAEDSLTEQNLASSPTKGQVKLDGTDLEIEDAGTMLVEADIVNDLTTGGATKPLSAEQGKTLKAAQDLKVPKSDIVDNVTSTDTDKPLSANQGKVVNDKIVLDFANPEYIDDAKPISQNFERLDNQVKTLSIGTGIISYRIIYAEVKLAGTAAGNTPAAYTEWQETIAFAVLKIKLMFCKKNTDTKILFYFQSNITANSGTIRFIIGGYPFDGTVTGAAWADYSIEIDVADLSDGLHEIGIYMLTDTGADTIKLRKPVIQVQTN